MPADDRWRPRNPGPVVRPYAVTGGRTEPVGELLDLLAVVVAINMPGDARDGLRLTPEHRRILEVCRRRSTVADVAADVALPVGVVRVLLADLIKDGAVIVVRPRPAGEQASTDMLQEILNGLRAL
ncbi:MAG TPA: DUF742 domain-containing protein [Streptosporangiaceae bacterium]|nr:DUF742 domain-containing protein [Streptosporangiaceae bacterium]